MSATPPNSSASIGVFDSGMGGLTVLAALRTELPDENFIYLGDTARLPYGTKSAATVQRYAVQAAGALIQRGVKALVVACNTASGLALDTLASEFAPIPVYGVVQPGAAAAAETADDSGVLVLATESTVQGGAYQRALSQRVGKLPLIARACPLWVTLAEMGSEDDDLIRTVLKSAMPPGHPTTVLLGCTHFPVFRSHLEGLFPETRFVDSAATTAAQVAADLAVRSLLTDATGATLEFLATDGVARFCQVGAHFLGAQINGVELIDL